MPAAAPTTDHLSQLMLEFYEKMASWEHSVVKQTGLSPAQMHAIEMIGHHPNLRMKELASRMGITTGTLTVMIDRLAKNDLVTDLHVWQINPGQTAAMVRIDATTPRPPELYKKRLRGIAALDHITVEVNRRRASGDNRTP